MHASSERNGKNMCFAKLETQFISHRPDNSYSHIRTSFSTAIRQSVRQSWNLIEFQWKTCEIDQLCKTITDDGRMFFLLSFLGIHSFALGSVPIIINLAMRQRRQQTLREQLPKRERKVVVEKH